MQPAGSAGPQGRHISFVKGLRTRLEGVDILFVGSVDHGQGHRVPGLEGTGRVRLDIGHESAVHEGAVRDGEGRFGEAFSAHFHRFDHAQRLGEAQFQAQDAALAEGAAVGRRPVVGEGRFPVGADLHALEFGAIDNMVKGSAGFLRLCGRRIADFPVYDVHRLSGSPFAAKGARGANFAGEGQLLAADRQDVAVLPFEFETVLPVVGKRDARLDAFDARKGDGQERRRPFRPRFGGTGRFHREDFLLACGREEKGREDQIMLFHNARLFTEDNRHTWHRWPLPSAPCRVRSDGCPCISARSRRRS